MADHWAMGGEGAADVARAVVKVCDSGKSKLKFLYPDDMPLIEKIRTIAREIYRAKDISVDKSVRDQLALVRSDGLRQGADLRRQNPVQLLDQSGCEGRARRSHDQCARGAFVGGAEFVVAICGEIMTMPGLPKVPSAEAIDIGADGKIVGLF
jgi:formate--tetrahydrofolate ligase